jgi:hypothetical protein
MDPQRPKASPTAGSGSAAADTLAVGSVVLAWYLAPAVVQRVPLPPFLAYVFGPGSHWLLVLAAVALSVSLGRRTSRLRRVASRLLGAAAGRSSLLWVFVAALVGVGFARVPDLRRDLANIGGDEPKYLRIALSLVNDTDIDISGGRATPPDLGLRLSQLRSLAMTTRDAVVGILRPTDIPPEHCWDAGNWSVRGLHGGVYHLQPPGLPALLAVFLGFGQALFPERGAAGLAAEFLVCFWILGAIETYKLTRDVLASRMAALLATAMLFATAPVFVGGYHLYPESVALFLVPFCYRRLRAAEPPLGSRAAIAGGLVAGGLWWIHPKFVAPSLVLIVIGLLRPRASAMARSALASSFVLVAGSSLLYVHYVTGLLRPEGLYIRQAQEYVGVPPLASLAYVQGLVNGLFGPRDGIFVLAPVLLLGVASLPAAFGARRRTTLELFALFGATWLTAAVHGGVSLASPARLFVPVAFAPMLLLALATRAVGARPRVLVPVLFLSLISFAVTARTASHWRLTLNPYRGLFVSQAHDFTRSLPSREPVRAVVASGALRTLLLLGAVLVLGARWTRRAIPDTGAGLEALYLLALMVVLAFALDAAGPRLFNRSSWEGGAGSTYPAKLAHPGPTG